MDITNDWNRARKHVERRQMYIEATEIYNFKVKELRMNLKRKSMTEVPKETD